MEKNIGNIQETDNLETADIPTRASGCRIAASSKRPMERILIFVIQSVLIGDGSSWMKSSDKLHVYLESFLIFLLESNRSIHEWLVA